jgi:hypothetical protein
MSICVAGVLLMTLAPAPAAHGGLYRGPGSLVPPFAMYAVGLIARDSSEPAVHAAVLRLAREVLTVGPPRRPDLVVAAVHALRPLGLGARGQAGRSELREGALATLWAFSAAPPRSSA